MLQVTAVGYLAADPEIKTIKDTEVANFVLMVNKKIKGEDQVSVIKCAVWGPKAKVVGDYLSKGSQATVTGQAYVEVFERKDGSPGGAINLSITDFSLPPKQKDSAEDMPF